MSVGYEQEKINPNSFLYVETRLELTAADVAVVVVVVVAVAAAAVVVAVAVAQGTRFRRIC